ncbi:MAG: hypothetical protein NT178_15920 [Proteobacteria bacterium]|nr:hypothetical protein [Pseudomonadota bacterium]
MYDYDLNYIYEITGLSDTERRSLINYYARLPEPVRIEAHKIQTDLMRQMKTGQRIKEKQAEFTYAMLVLALRKMKRIETGEYVGAGMEKIRDMRAGRIMAAKKKKTSRIKDLIELRYYALITQLREKELGWREIAKYLEKYHKSKITFSYLRQCYEQITLEHKMRGEE